MRPKVVMTALAVAVAVLAVVAGANAASSSNKPLPGKGVKFGLSLPGLASPGSVAVLEGVKCYAKRAGGTVQAVDPGQDINKQISQVTDLINGGTKAILITPFSPSVIKALAPKAKAKGAVIVEFQNAKSTANGTVYNYISQTGKLAAEYFKKHSSGEVRAVVIGGPPIPLAKALEDGFTTNAKKLGITVLEVAHAMQFSSTTGRTIGADLLSKHPDANAIFVIESSLGIGAGLAVKARGSNAKVIDQDGSKTAINAIKNGTLTATVDMDQGYNGFAAAAVGAKALATKKNVKPLAIQTKLWDKSNLKQWKTTAARCSSLK